MPVPSVPRLMCLVDATDDLALLPLLAGAGVDAFQVRAKDLADARLLDLARTVVAAARPHGARVLVNDRVDVALAAGADGVHLGREDLPVAEVRRLAPDLLLGATCRDRSQVVAARRQGADYAGFGPVFATSSKSGLPDPLGPAAVGRAAGVLPLVAIGGVGEDNAAELVAAGAHGLAVLGGIWRRTDPVSAAGTLAAVLR